MVHTNHYDGDGDNPAWTQESATAWTRNISGIGGGLVGIYDSATQSTSLQLALGSGQRGSPVPDVPDADHAPLRACPGRLGLMEHGMHISKRLRDIDNAVLGAPGDQPAVGFSITTFIAGLFLAGMAAVAVGAAFGVPAADVTTALGVLAIVVGAVARLLAPLLRRWIPTRRDSRRRADLPGPLAGDQTIAGRPVSKVPDTGSDGP